MHYKKLSIALGILVQKKDRQGNMAGQEIVISDLQGKRIKTFSANSFSWFPNYTTGY